MKRNNTNWRMNPALILLFMLVLVPLASLVVLPLAIAAPQGPLITYNNTLNVTPTPAAQIATAGGSFTILSLNATTQTPRWKAYVGNVSGRLVLDDANSYSVFDWAVSSVTGEVYATRNSSIDWSTIGCANLNSIYSEESLLNMSSSNADSINNTFRYRTHKTFYVGLTRIINSTCPSFATYINDTAQTMNEDAKFLEILLNDTYGRTVYTTLVNQNTTGFNNQKFDFQMIVPEDEFKDTPSTYYLYVELI